MGHIVSLLFPGAFVLKFEGVRVSGKQKLTCGFFSQPRRLHVTLAEYKPPPGRGVDSSHWVVAEYVKDQTIDECLVEQDVV